jgi:hypothetical protein
MKEGTAVIIMVVVMLLCLPPTMAAKDCGVLLGLRAMTRGGPEYRTVWITSQNGTIELSTEGGDILVPRDTGFWRAGTRRLVDEQWQMDVAWAVPANKKPSIPGLAYDEGCEGSDFMTILFVGNTYVSFDREGGGYCEGAAHPWAVNWLEVFSLDDMQGEGGCVPLSECAGEGANTQLLVAAEQYRSGLSEEGREMLEEEPTDCSWGLIRRHGQWVLRGRLRYSFEVYRGHYADFDIPIDPPTSLVSHDELHPSWEKVKSRVPGAVDAFSSPGRDLLVVLTQSTLTAHPVAGGVIGEAAFSLELGSNEAAVMIQWAEGKHVQRWSEKIDTYIGSH